MVVGAFPVAKLGVLLVKQISKPIANVLKERAKHSPFFRVYVCMPPAQLYNWLEIKTKMWTMNLGKPVNVPVLNEAMAIDLGANLLGEFIIFFIGAGLLILEYTRQVRNEAFKQDVTKQEKLELVATLNDLAFRVERQDTQMQELSRMIAELESRSWTRKILGGKMSGTEEDERLSNLPENRFDNHNTSEHIVRTEKTNVANIMGGGDRPNGIINRALDYLLENERTYNNNIKCKKLTYTNK